MSFSDNDPLLEIDRIVHMLRHLLLFFEIGGNARHLQLDKSYYDRETLLCLKTSLEKAIQTLPERERAVIALVGLQALSESEAARRLGISQPTVSKRLKTAAIRVKKFLTQR